MAEKLIEIQDQGKLAGVLHIPDNYSNKCPIVIYCPGKNGERYEVHRLAVKLGRELEKKGIAFLRFDYYGIGLSDGKYFEMTTKTKVSNVEKALDYVKLLPFVDNDKIFFLGFSDGARIALMTAVETGHQKLILWSPLFSEFGGDYPSGKHPKFIKHKKSPDYIVMPWAGLWLSIDFYKNLYAIDIEDYFTNFRGGKSLIIFGDNDPLIAEEFEKMEKENILFSNTNDNKVIKIKGAGHLFTSQILENELISISIAWINNNLESS